MMSVPGSEDIDFRMFVERSIDLFAVATADGYFSWLNPAWTRLLGWSLDELKADLFLSFVHPDDVEATLREVARLGAGEETIEFTNRYRCKDGTYRWIQWSAYQRGGLSYASARDVTKLKETLRSAQREVQTLLLAEQLGEFGHWRVDLQATKPKVQWSPNVFRIHGRDPSEFEPSLESGVEAYHPDDQPAVAAHIETAIAEKRGWDFRLRLVRPTGELRHVRAIGECELDSSNGNVKALFGVFQDLTETEATQRAANQELEQFAYRAAHDLQAPLRTISGFVRLLRDELDGEVSETVNTHLGFIESGTAKLRNLIQELFRYAKTVGDESELEPVDMAVVAQTAVDACQAELAEVGAEVEIGALPTVPGRRGALDSVVLNLIDNAIKYRSEEPLRVKIDCEPYGDSWRFRVVDNGIGVPQPHLERIFKLFERVAARNAAGVGLGLSMCRKVLERLGGRIWAELNPTGGCVIVFTTPRRPEAEDRSQALVPARI